MDKTCSILGAITMAMFFGVTGCSNEKVEDPTNFGDTGTDDSLELQNKRELDRLTWEPYTNPEKEFRVRFTKRPKVDDTSDVRSYSVDAGNAGDFEVWVVPHGEDELWETREELIMDLTTEDPDDKERIINKESKTIQFKGADITEVRLKINGFYFEYTTENGIKTGAQSPLNSSRIYRFIPAGENKTYFLSMDTLRPAPAVETEFFGSFTILEKEAPVPEKKD